MEALRRDATLKKAGPLRGRHSARGIKKKVYKIGVGIFSRVSFPFVKENTAWFSVQVAGVSAIRMHNITLNPV